MGGFIQDKQKWSNKGVPQLTKLETMDKPGKQVDIRVDDIDIGKDSPGESIYPAKPLKEIEDGLGLGQGSGKVHGVPTPIVGGQLAPMGSTCKR